MVAAQGQPAPGTPPRKRQLAGEKQHPVARRLTQKRPRPANTEGTKAASAKAASAQADQAALKQAALKHAFVQEEFRLQLQRHGVPEASHERLLSLLEAVGPARVAQVLGLWTFLGDGIGSKPPGAAALQVWGPAGSGKTEVLGKYLTGMGLSHVHLSCNGSPSLGEFWGRLAEELRAKALTQVEEQQRSLPAEELRQLRRVIPSCRQIRSLDRLEQALRLPLQHLSGKVVVVLDQAQTLPKLGPGAEELVLDLPEVLQRAGQLVFVFVGRLPLSCLGVPESMEPASVAFQPYAPADVERVMSQTLTEAASRRVELPRNAGSSCARHLMTFAVPFLGHNLHDLLRIGEEVLRTGEPVSLGKADHAGRLIERLVQQRLGLCDLGGLLERGQEVEGPAAALAATMRRMVKTEKFLLVAAYLGSRLHKDDDEQHFIPAGRGSHKRGRVVRHPPDPLAEPTTVSLGRLLAIYHRLARKQQELSPTLLEQLMRHHSAGLIRFVGGPGPMDRDAKLACRVELPLARACAFDCGIDLRECGL